jgi:O-antigen/teichoic acid export membrane protein
VTAIVVARLLGVEAFGQFVLIQSTSLMLQSVGGLGLGLATTRLVASLRGRDPDRTGRVIGFSLLFTLVSGIVLACLVLAVPAFLIRSAMGMDDQDGIMLWVGLIAFTEMLNRIQADVLIGLEAFSGMASVSLVRGVMILSFTTLGACAFGLPGAVAALAAASLVTSMVTQIVLRRACMRQAIALTFRGILSEYGILGTSLFVTGSSLTLAVVTWILNVSLARQANGLAELAIFNGADRWRTALLFLPGLLAQVCLPLLAHTHAQGRGDACRRLVIGTSSISLAVTAVPVIIVILLSPVLMAGYGDTFVRGKPVLVLLAMACLPTSLSMVGAYGLWATGKTGTMLAIDVVRASIALLYCLLQPSFVAYDVAVATLVSYLVVTPLIGLALWRTIGSRATEGRLVEVVVGTGAA